MTHNKLLKHFGVLCLIGTLAFAPITTNAASLDDVINQNQIEVQQEGQTEVQPVQEVQQEVKQEQPVKEVKDNSYIDNLYQATVLDKPDEKVTLVNTLINKVISSVVQVIAVATMALLVVRVVFDLCYIALPFSRKFLNGSGRQVANPTPAPVGMGMPGGMGMTGGLSAFGGGQGMMPGGGFNRPGMQGMGAMGGPGMGAEAPQANNPGTIQLISEAAMRAVQASQSGQNPFKMYVGDMIVILVAIPVLFVLAMSGALSQLGLLLGQAIVAIIKNLGSFI